jgi:hypothetical protein
MGVNYEDREAGVEIPQTSEKEERSEAKSFFKYNLGAAYSYRIDFETLSTTLTRIVLAGGNVGRTSGSGGFRYAIAVKDRLHTKFVTFPSHHMGYLTYPRTFAKQLREVLNNKEEY